MSDTQMQCDAGHFYTPVHGEDQGCPTCAAAELELTKTRVFPGATFSPATAPGWASNDRALDEGATIGAYASMPVAREPVVGWLVCTKGVHLGQDWRLIAGRNSIGRSENHHVCLGRDSAVSRDKHALISFDARHRHFRVLPGDSTGLAYLNGEEVATPVQLKAFDVIELGDTTLVFVPFVSAQFSWTAA
jgi:hypothetical protein